MRREKGDDGLSVGDGNGGQKVGGMEGACVEKVR